MTCDTLSAVNVTLPPPPPPDSGGKFSVYSIGLSVGAQLILEMTNIALADSLAPPQCGAPCNVWVNAGKLLEIGPN